MNDKVKELYEQSNKRKTRSKTIGDEFYDYWEMKIKRNKTRKEMLKKMREEEWNHLEK